MSAVFTAAEKAANDMLKLAREQADDIRRKAEAEARTHLSQRRSDAQGDAMRVLAGAGAEAEAEAHRIRQTARENASEIEDARRRTFCSTASTGHARGSTTLSRASRTFGGAASPLRPHHPQKPTRS